jgi:hypothetical protein
MTDVVPDSFEERARCCIICAREAHGQYDTKVCAECERRIEEMIAET